MTWKPGEPVRIGTPQYILRSIRKSDVTPQFIRWNRDPEIIAGQNLHGKPMTRDVAMKTMARADNRRIFYLMILASVAEKPIGYYAIQANHADKYAETTVVIGDKSYWGKKVVLATRPALLDFLFDQLRMEKVLGRPHGRNTASVFNYKALGFTCEAVLRDQLVSVTDGGRIDQLVFGILKDEWHSKRQELAT